MQPYRHPQHVWRPNPEPITLTLLAVGGVAALIAFLRARARDDESEYVAGPEEEPPTNGGGTSTGIGGTAADHTLLTEAGYSATPTGVENFQREFNAVNDWVVANGDQSLGANRLTVDGKIGPQTSTALKSIDTAQFRYSRPWQELVSGVVPSLADAQALLQSHGYGTDQSSVEQFQNEFNAVNASLGNKLTDKPLGADGVLGPRTRSATRLADVAQFTEGKTWAELVAAAPNA